MTSDTHDARHTLQRQSLEAAAEEILTRHTKFIEARDGASEATATVCREAFEIAALVANVRDQLGATRFGVWWRDSCMPPEWGQKYLRLARTSSRRENPDNGQLRMLGILPQPVTSTVGQRQRQPNPFAWIKWTAKVVRWFTPETIAGMDRIDRDSALKHLRPLRQLIEALEG